MPLDKGPPRLHGISHQNREYLVGFDGIIQRHLENGPRLGIHGGVPQLLRIHFSKTFVALERHTFFAVGLNLRKDVAKRLRFSLFLFKGKLEPHFFEFNGDLYGQTIAIEFIEYLRPEAKFAGIDDLVAQMGRDCSEARRILAAKPRLA